MSSMTQEQLDNIAWLEQERRRIKNEEIETARRSTELSIQRCQTELGITDPTITSTIASEVLRAEEAERLQVAAVRLYSREIQRLVSTGGQPLPGVHVIDGARRINDVRRELTRAQEELESGRQGRRYRLCRYINQCRIESTRIKGRECGFALRNEIVSECARRPVYDGVGHIVAFGAKYLRVGGADDYLTVHNPAYPRVSIVRNIAPNFRNIKVKGNTIAIRALKNAHGYAYAFMMGDRQEFPFSRSEPGLLREDPVKRQPVTARIRDFAVDAGHGRGYALAVQGHGDDGQFHGIASYNRVSEISPNEFFDTTHLSDEKCRMADFNFQLVYGKLPIETEIEVGTLLIEHARYYFGARLFCTECSPLNVRYTDIMQALGLRRFHTVEPASFNPTLAAATWKFDLWSWKAAEEELKRQGQWFVNKDTMQEDPEAERRPIHEDPEEPLPSLAIVQAVPTVHEDPAAFETTRQPTHSVQSHFGPVPWPQTSESIEWSSGSYLTGNTGTTDTGTSSGLGYSESDQTQSNSSTIQSRSPTDSSSESLASITREASRAFIVADEQLTDSPVCSELRVWQGSVAVGVLREEEDSRAMPPPMLPKNIPSQPTSSSESSANLSSESDVTHASMNVDSPPRPPSDAKGNRPTSSISLGELDPSTQTELPATGLYNEEGDWRVSEQWPVSDSSPACALWSEPGLWLHETVPGTEVVSQASMIYDRKGKRPASLTWDAQPKRPSPLRQTLTPEETIGDIMLPSAHSVDHRGMSQPLHAPPDDASPKTARPSWPNLNQQFCSRNSAAIQSSHEEFIPFSPRSGHSESNSTSSKPPVAWQQRNHSPAPYNDSAMFVLPDLSRTSRSYASPSNVPEPGTELAVDNQRPTQLMRASQSNAAPLSSVIHIERVEDGSQWPVLHTIPAQAKFHHENLSQSTNGASRPWSNTNSVEELTSNTPRSKKTPEHQQQMRPPVPGPSPGRRQDHLRQQHRTHASQTESFTQTEPASTHILRQSGSESGYHNMTVYNYVELVQERPGEQQRQPSMVQTRLPPEKISKDDRQASVGYSQANGNKSANLLNVKKPAKTKQISTPVTRNLKGQQESNTTRLQLSQDERKEQKTSPISKPTQATRATAAQSSSILDTLLSNIALVPGPHVTSTPNAGSASDAPSTVHLINNSQLLPARNVHESSTFSRERLTQHTAYLTATPHQVAPQPAARMTIAELTSPNSTFSSESDSEKKSKQRPWQL
ncbi:hypothetical protein CRV24_005582 [Beauveria bassiana]|nr:hypothetical protein CRV24_005582 [Beauveria bassiana]